MIAGNRLDLRSLSPHTAPATFADDVRAGLTAARKWLPPKYFYDDLGSTLFEAICLLPEYYLTRAEREILERFSPDIAARFDGTVELIELGSGNAEKTRLLVDALFARQATLHYTMVDISTAALERASAALLDRYPSLGITAYASDYMGALEAISDSETRHGDRRLALFLGSNIGNLDEASAIRFLRALRDALSPGDAVLLGADLRKERATLEAAYDDPLGVTAAFNLNLLVRINRELGANFDITRFRHHATWDEADGCMRMHLESLVPQQVAVAALDLTIAFGAGETIHTEDSRKYSIEDISRLAESAGFELAESWYDGARLFSSSLLVACS